MTTQAKAVKFVGSSSRSRTGCLACKRKKKKCDEKKPICGLCSVSRNSVCEWVEPAKYKNSRRDKTEMKKRRLPIGGNDKVVPIAPKVGGPVHNSIPLPSSSASAATTSPDSAAAVDSSITSRSGISPTITKLVPPGGLLAATTAVDEMEVEVEVGGAAEVPDEPPTDKEEFRVDYKTYSIVVATEKEKSYLESYIKFAESMSIVGHTNSAFYAIFLPLAAESSVVLQALITWGGMAMGGSNELICRRHNLPATMREIEASTSPSSAKISRLQCDYYLSACLILLDAEVSRGCVKQWKYLFDKSLYIIKYMGLLNDILDPIKIYRITEVEKWLVVNFLHHELLSSRTHVHGTVIPSNILLQLGGLDTFEGCLKPCLLLLSEAINLSIEAKEKYKLMEDPGKQNNYKTTQELNRITALTLDLDSRMIDSKPRPEDLAQIPKSYLEKHLSLFELYQFSIQIYLRIAIRRYSPNVPEIQILLYKTINMLNYLVSSNLKSALKFPFLIAGISCVHEFDKIKVMDLLDKYEASLNHLNIAKIKMIIRNVWSLGEGGNVCLDWHDIAIGFGWELCLV